MNTMIDDHDLLQQYATTRSDEPFGELVRRHLDIVYAAALRQTHGNVHLAKEITQSVFTDLARKAGTLNRRTILVGWLHTAVRFAATKAMRSAARRERHERAAATEMNDELHSSEPPIDPAQLQPVIDAAIGDLKPREREAVLMRFFEHREFADLGARLALSESAARSCVDRALKKMRASLERHGVKSSTAALAVALGHQSVVAAPIGLAAVVTTQATTIAAAATTVAPATLFFLSMTKLHCGLIGALAIGSGLGIAVGIQLADRNRELAQLRPQSALVADLQRENQALRRRLAETRPPAEVNPPSTPSTAAPAPSAAMQAPPSAVASRNIVDDLVKVEEIQNHGAATPAAAFQTIVWAAMQGKTDALANVLMLEPGAVEVGDAFVRQLSPDKRSIYKSANHLVALITEKEVLEKGSKMLILDTKHHDDARASVSVLLSDTEKGRKHPYVKEIQLVRVGSQWGLPIRKEVVEGTIQKLREDPK
jgi:RNA polymerase sigma factor (sigma-70 family)